MRGSTLGRKTGAVIATSAQLSATPRRREPAVLLAVGLVALVLSVVGAKSVGTWFLEVLAALIGGSSADEFLGTQGDVWDTQWDMFLAGVGAITSLLLLSRLHNRQLRDLHLADTGTAQDRPNYRAEANTCATRPRSASDTYTT